MSTPCEIQGAPDESRSPAAARWCPEGREQSPSDLRQRFIRYPSPSRDAGETPVRQALRASNHDVRVFLKNLEALSRFKRGIATLERKQPRDGEENQAPHAHAHDDNLSLL